MSSKIKTVITFKIERIFDEWAKIFDNKESYLRHSDFNIKPLFRGFIKADLEKVIRINKAPEGNINNFVQENSEWIKRYKVDFFTGEESFWM